MHTLPRIAKVVTSVLNLSLMSKEVAFENNQGVKFGKKWNYFLLLLLPNKEWLNFLF